MRFNVEDFGLEARGRCLEHVSVEANSSTCPSARWVHSGGRYRQADLDPGRGRYGRRRSSSWSISAGIDGAAIVAGDDELTFALEEGADGFRDSVHEGWRITVQGAGAAGARLVTSVAEVLEPRSKTAARRVRP